MQSEIKALIKCTKNEICLLQMDSLSLNGTLDHNKAHSDPNYKGILQCLL